MDNRNSGAFLRHSQGKSASLASTDFPIRHPFSSIAKIFLHKNHAFVVGEKAQELRCFACLHALGKRAQVGCSDLDTDVFTRTGVEHALLDDIRLESTARGAHGVTAAVARCSFLAGFDAGASHEPEDCTCMQRLRQS